MEACAGAHWLGCKLKGLGFQVRILPAQYVKPFVQNQKNDANDALAIAEASQRPSVRPAPIKTQSQLHLQTLHRVRDRLVNQRTRLINQMRGFLLEEGIILRTGVGNFKNQLPVVLSDPRTRQPEDFNLYPASELCLRLLSSRQLVTRLDSIKLVIFRPGLAWVSSKAAFDGRQNHTRRNQ